MGTALADALKTNAVDALKTQLIEGLEAQVRDLEAQRVDMVAKLDALEDTIEEKKYGIDAVRKALDIPVKPTRNRADLYYIHSRSGDTDGHFIEHNSSATKCSCPGFKYNGKCWASTYIKNSSAYSVAGFSYSDTVAAFDNHAVPTGASFYVPNGSLNMRA